MSARHAHLDAVLVAMFIEACRVGLLDAEQMAVDCLQSLPAHHRDSAGAEALCAIRATIRERRHIQREGL